MLNIDKSLITHIVVNNPLNRPIAAIYQGARLVWLPIYNAIKSCFGSGIWKSDKPWLGGDLWKNN